INDAQKIMPSAASQLDHFFGEDGTSEGCCLAALDLRLHSQRQDSSCQASQMAAVSIPHELLHDRALRTFRTRPAPQVIARLGSCRTNDHRPDLARSKPQ